MVCETLPDYGLHFRQRLVDDACLSKLLMYNDENGEHAYRIHRNHVPDWGEDGELWSERFAEAAAQGQCLTLGMPEILPWIWFQLRDVEQSECINAVEGALPEYVYFDVEIVSQRIGETEEINSAFIQAIALKGIRSELFGHMLVDELIVTGQGDTYEPKSMRGADWGFHWRALSVQLMPIAINEGE